MSRLRVHSIFQWMQSPQPLKILQPSNLMKTCSCCFSSESQSPKETNVKKLKSSLRRAEEFVAPSPYKNPGPRRYGFDPKYMTQGCLPRDGERVKNRPAYRATDAWDKKSSYFGQNDYIDILGDGDVHPSDLLTGPPWLIGFKGNERERLMRKMEWQGHTTKTLYPAEFNRMEKRIRYLTKLYNTKRHTRKRD